MDDISGISSLNQSVSNSDSLINKLEKAYSEKDKQKLKEACNEFEALMLSSVFKEMKKTIPEDGLIQRTIADDIFDEMLIDEVSKNAAKQGNVGISKMLYDSLLKRIENAYKAGKD